MKKALALCLCLLLLFSLTGCRDQAPASVTRGGTTYTIDPASRTITDGALACDYSISGNQITVTHPDGFSYTKSGNSYMGTGSLSGECPDNWDYGGFIDALEDYQEKGTIPWGRKLLALVLIGAGWLALAKPEWDWFLRRGWMYKDAEPSEAYLGVTRFSGILLLLVGLFLLLFGW